MSFESTDHPDCGVTKDLKSGDFSYSLVKKKFGSYDPFPSLKSDIYEYLNDYFVENPGPR